MQAPDPQGQGPHRSRDRRLDALEKELDQYLGSSRAGKTGTPASERGLTQQ